MFNSVGFEVVIGLVFVYLLYSLLITILGELVITKLGVRGSLLRVAIDRMLNDGYYKEQQQKAEAVVAGTAAPVPPAVAPIAPDTSALPPAPAQDAAVAPVVPVVAATAPPPAQGATATATPAAIVTVAMGEAIVQSWWDRFLLREPALFKESFAGKFYDQPSIKYLTKLDKHRPSYFSAENFSETMVSLLKDIALKNEVLCAATNINPASEVYDIISAILSYAARNHPIQPDTKSHLRNLFDNARKDTTAGTLDKVASVTEFKLQLKKWFDETMDRTNGWFKEKLRLILFILGFFLAAAFNVDSIKIAKILSKDKEARAKFVDMSTAFMKDSARYSNFVKTNGDTLSKADIIDSGYKNISADVDAANKVLGLGWNMDTLFKTDSYTVCRRVTARKGDSPNPPAMPVAWSAVLDDSAFSTLATAALRYKGYEDSMRRYTADRTAHVVEVATFKAELQRLYLDSLTRLTRTTVSTTVAPGRDSAILRKQAQLGAAQYKLVIDTQLILAYKVMYSASHSDLDSLLPTKFKAIEAIRFTTRVAPKVAPKKDSTATAKQDGAKAVNPVIADSSVTAKADTIKPVADSSNKATKAAESGAVQKVIAVPSDSLLHEVYAITIVGKVPYSWWDKLMFLLGAICWSNVVGYVITALAVSLGAPFWFDLLNKLVSMRGSGIKPEEKNDKKK